MTTAPVHLSSVTRAAVGDGLVAGAAAWACSGLPSTAWGLLRGANPLGAVRAAGSLVLSPDASPTALLVAGASAHSGISFAWSTLLALALPERHAVIWGTLAGGGIAALDLGLIGHRYPAIRALPTLPQVADHLAFGALVGAVVVRCRRRRRRPFPCPPRSGT